jgi:argininosuccinate lyase
MAKKLWGGRFTSLINKDFESFSRSIHYDVKLAEYDVLHSLLHVKALFNTKLITKEEKTQLQQALKFLLKEIRNGVFVADPDEEDIHSAVQNALERSVGNLALKLHTLRSRNDQIAFDMKLYCLTQAAGAGHKLDNVIRAFNELAAVHHDTPFVGYTHTQRAQIIRFGDYCRAYAEMFSRDRARLRDYPAHVRLQIGAGALAGSSIPFQNYEKAVKELAEEEGMILNIQPLNNAQEHVADRDHVVELLSALNLIQLHISRFSEDMILYSTAEFDYVNLPEAFCTGSSLMPHKKNADLLELLRGYSGRISGNLIELIVMLKGLPLTYNRDMQLDKEPLFESVEIVQQELDMLAQFVPGITLKSERIRVALNDEHLYGVEIAEYLVHNGVAFKKAHDIVGAMIRYAEDRNMMIRDIPEDKLREFHESLSPQSLKTVMTAEYALKQKQSIFREKA